MEAGELLLIDAGCEFEYYACDVTRTFPVSGKFSDAQRRVYQVVLDAQNAAIAVTKPGGSIEEIHRVTVRALVEGLVEIGLLRVPQDGASVDEIITKESFRRYYMHRTSHWLGMDVHDVGAYFVAGKARPLMPGMVLTIEPGIYISSEDAAAPEAYRGIGVRIEDDVLVTADGFEILSASIPKTIEDVESACSA
jgi:Xaa-Pro aminopeptidase